MGVCVLSQRTPLLGSSIVQEGVGNIAFCLIYRKTLSLEKVPNLCVGDCAYKRTDGVYVVPVGCLRDECSIICLVSCHRRGG